MFDFWNGVGNLLGPPITFQAALDYVFFTLLNIIAQVANALLNLQINIANFFYGGFGFLNDFLREAQAALWVRVFKRLLGALGIQSVWLEEKLRKLLELIERIRKWIDKIFKKYILPILNVIQKIRRFLLILRLLHVKWAAKLDAILGQVQSRIAGVFLEIRAALNLAIDVLNAGITADKLFRRPNFVVSLRSSFGHIFTALTGLPVGYFLPNFDSDSTTSYGDALSFLGGDYFIEGNSTAGDAPLACGQASPTPAASVDAPGSPAPAPSIPIEGFTSNDDLPEDLPPVEEVEPLGYFTFDRKAASACQRPSDALAQMIDNLFTDISIVEPPGFRVSTPPHVQLFKDITARLGQ